MIQRNQIYAMITIAAIASVLLTLPFGIQVSQTVAAAESSTSNTERTISVTGISSVKVTPDRITISFAVETQEKTAQQAAQSNAATTTKVIELLKAAGVSEAEISTSYYNIYPVYEYREEPVSCYTENGKTYCPPPVGRQVLVGYRAVNSIAVESAKLDRAGAWIDAAVEAGANRVDYLYFSLSIQKQDEIRNSLLPMAIQDARSKAQTALDPLGMQITNVLNINLDSYPPVIYPKRGFEYAPGAQAPTTPVIPGSQEVSATVHVTFEIGGFESGATATSMEASVGETFTVTLDSNPSTGYRWETSAIANSQLVRFVKSEFVQSESGLVGAGGKQVLAFQALKEGKTTIVLEYVRSWEKEKPAETYIISLTVR